MSDIRKWFMKSHNKGNDSASKADSTLQSNSDPSAKVSKPALTKLEPVQGGQESSGRRKTSKYFATDKQKPQDEKRVEEVPVKRKLQNDSKESLKPPPLKKHNKIDDEDDDFVLSKSKKNHDDATPSKKLKSASGRGVPQKTVDVDQTDEDDVKDAASPSKPGGRGRGGRGALGAPSGGRGRGGGRGGFMNFGERKEPPHKGEKEVPEGARDCLAGLTFVISGTLDSLEREEAEDLIKRHGGRVTGSVSKKTNYLLCDEDIVGRKSSKAKELGTLFLTEDGLFDMIRASKPVKAALQGKSNNLVEKPAASLTKKSPCKVEVKSKSEGTKASSKRSASEISTLKQKRQTTPDSSLSWTDKYKPKVPNEIVGNQSLVNQLHAWLERWHNQFSNAGSKGKGKKQSDSGAKKAVLLSGAPGIGKTTSAKLVSQMLHFQAIEVNASDSRGKADAKISKGIGGSNANSIKELVSNEALGAGMDRSKHPKTVLIMDEVDGMSAGDRGGIADLIASIKISKIPIICICNDRYSQKLKSLVNYCLLLNYRKPTKQQMAKRLMQVAKAEGLQVNEIALEELAERVNGDMRMALNQLQYMSLSMSVIKYDDIRRRLLSSSKDEDISPFTAVDKLFGFNGGRLRMDERIDLSMSDPDLVPLLIQENYINYRPSSVSKDDSGVKRLGLLARAAESIGDGDIINVQIRRYRQWQLSQSSSVASCIIPYVSFQLYKIKLTLFKSFFGTLNLLPTLMPTTRERNVIVAIGSMRSLAIGRRETLRLEHLTLLLKRLTNPLRMLPKVGNPFSFFIILCRIHECLLISRRTLTLCGVIKVTGTSKPAGGIAPAVKAALTRAYNEGSKLRMVRAADLVSLPGIKKAPRKRVAAMLEPSNDGPSEENGSALAESEEENTSDAEDLGTTDGEKLQTELQSLNSKGIEVQVDLKGTGKSSAKKASAGRGKGGSASAEKKSGGRGSGAAANKRKR
ncbi:replication factor C subunit 1 [Carica papaya]|uniref:replication factor C subunit 1 n=1 Tax=Carica papaya TaxID=3649 RepID=UPI000B8CBEBA|nr:replication factor C subunit 1 [Carica papaya]